MFNLGIVSGKSLSFLLTLHPDSASWGQMLQMCPAVCQQEGHAGDAAMMATKAVHLIPSPGPHVMEENWFMKARL